MSIDERPVERADNRTTATRRRDSERAPLWAIAAAALLPVLLVGGWVVADAVQPHRYSPVRQTVSVMAGHAGRYRWIMTSALIVIGLGYLVAAAGLARLGELARFGLLIDGAAGIGIAFSPQPMHGSTTQHQSFTAVGALVLAVWPLMAVRFHSGATWAQRWTTAVPVTIVFVGLTAWLAYEALTSAGAVGLAERLVSSLEVVWPAVVALSLLPGRRAPEPD